MAEEQDLNAAAGNGQADQQQASMTVQHVYLKDCSFEAPGALSTDQNDGQPDMNLNLSQRVNPLGEDRYEVVLSVTVTAKQGEKTVFIAEVHYAGVFHIHGFTEQQMPFVMNVHCPNTLYPYARTQVANLIAAGGFFSPPLQPISFEAIFAQRVAEQQQAATESGGNSGDSAVQ